MVEKVILVILAILLPPLAVYLDSGKCGDKFWIDVILTILCWFPGVIYALYVLFETKIKLAMAV